jgi:Flp pilus assembly protein TadD
VLAAVCACVTLVQWPVLDNQAVMFDDAEYLLFNPLVQRPGWSSAGRFLTEVSRPSTVAGYYQPLSMISLMLDYAAGGRPNNLRPFHATSLGLHVACSGMVFLLVLALFRQVWAAAAAALLFGLHPGAVESTSWVSDRKTLLASAFALASLLVYVRYARSTSRPAFVCAAALFALSLLSKPTTTALPVLMLLLDVWPLGRWGRRAVLEKLPLFAIAIASAVITVISQGSTAELTAPTALPAGGMAMVVCHNVVFYLHKCLWPVNLSAHYPYPEPVSMADAAVRWGVIGTPVLIGGLLVSLRWTRALLTGWLFFLIALLPAMGIVGFTQTIAADRFAYFPRVGLLLAMAAGLAWIAAAGRNRPVLRAGVVALVVLALAGETVLTRRYLAEWKDTLSFARYMVAHAPRSAYLHNNLGRVLLAVPDLREAEREFREAIRLGKSSQAHVNLAAMEAERGRMDVAESHLRESIRLYAADPLAHTLLAKVLDRVGRTGEAVSCLREAARLQPARAEARRDLARALYRLGRYREAAAEYEAWARLEPGNAQVRHDLGCCLLAERKVREGLAEWEKALALRPDWVGLMNNLAWIRATAEEPGVRDAGRALELAGRMGAGGVDQPSLLDTLAAAQAAAGKHAEAAATARRAMELATSAGDRAAVSKIDRRIRAYEAGQGWREAVRGESYPPSGVEGAASSPAPSGR